MAKQAEPSRYCLKCRYCLDHLAEHRCPECGRAFDPNKPKTYSNHPLAPWWPSWETYAAILMLGLLVYLSWDWYGVREVFGTRSLVHWLNAEAPIIHRVEQLIWSAPFIGLIPAMFAIGLKRRRHNYFCWVLTIIGMLIYATWPGTWLWFQDLPDTLTRVHAWEGYWEAWRKNLDRDEW